MEKEGDKAEEAPPPVGPINVRSSLQLNPQARMASSEEDGEVRGPGIVDHGSISVMGRRLVMEDVIMKAPEFLPAYDFFGVYDGHGGSIVANICKERMHVVLAKEVAELATEADEEGRWREAMASCFAKVDLEVEEAFKAAIIDGTMGASALVAVVGERRIVVGSCGNCRAILCRDKVAIPLSNDHKADRPDERERVEAAGGKVISWNGHRIMGVLTTSRSIGDFNLKPFVISEPEVTVLDRTEEDEFIVLGSEGFWDCVTNDMACDIARQCLTQRTIRGYPIILRGCTHAAITASLLGRFAMARGSWHNISVMVVQLKTMENIDVTITP